MLSSIYPFLVMFDKAMMETLKPVISHARTSRARNTLRNGLLAFGLYLFVDFVI